MNSARRCTLVFCLLALAISALPETASADRMGIALRWNRCFGEEGAEFVRSFACDTNLGSESLVGSFALPWDMPQVSGIEIVMDVMTYAGVPGVPSGGPLPAWWQFRNVGSCRLTSLNMLTVGIEPDVVCTPLWTSGDEASGIGGYHLSIQGMQGTARLIAVAAVPQQSVFLALGGVEYNAFTIRINHAKTLGTGACDGCLVPMQVLLRSVNVVPVSPASAFRLTDPMDGERSSYVLWGTGPVPTKRSSWSAVKSLYR